MALRLVRQTSDTPNITNKDDVIMTRYAYGGYNGVVNGFGKECGYTAENGIFKILDGRIVVDGWEIDVDGAGWSFDFSNITGTQYHSVYAEINVATETVKIDSTYLTGSYPEITKGDDLTQIPNGTARLLLYEVVVENGTITKVSKKVEVIRHLVEVIRHLKDRLDELGFRKGIASIEVINEMSPQEFSRNSLTKQGQQVSFQLSIGAQDGLDYIGEFYVKIPEEFKPLKDAEVLLAYTLFLNAYYIKYYDWYKVSSQTGYIIDNNNQPLLISGVMRELSISGGWTIKGDL